MTGPNASNLRYIDPMYEVLAFVYENYWDGQACPDREQLSRKLSTAGFERKDIQQALAWLEGLQHAARGLLVPADTDHGPRSSSAQLPPTWPAAPDSMRVYAPLEMERLGVECLACIHFLESAGALPPELREVVIDRALAVPEPPLDLDDLKIIVLMVYWSVGVEPDALILDELCDDSRSRVIN